MHGAIHMTDKKAILVIGAEIDLLTLLAPRAARAA
jgi:hypothetical protein